MGIQSVKTSKLFNRGGLFVLPVKKSKMNINSKRTKNPKGFLLQETRFEVNENGFVRIKK